ncbi:MAG: adenylyl-sulfate kinase [Gammaproteobacteria bacterium]|nr:adenylyl-sulfate kinase [Gammaproteobacteria bacterium]
MNQKSTITNENTVWHEPTIRRIDREKLNNHKSVILWFTGLSGSGKSTLAHAIEDTLFAKGIRTYVLDGDNVRRGLCQDLGFSDADRTENIRRVGEISRLLMDAGVLTLTAFISPFSKDRQLVRDLHNKDEFIEIYCNSPLVVCEQRDVKGMYRKARAGEIAAFTGISSPYEAPEKPEIELDTANQTVQDCVNKVVLYLEEQGVIEG